MAQPQTPAQAWAALLDGNARFAADRAVHPRQDSARRAETATRRAPLALVLTCMDSRVSPEIIFDQGIGDLAVVRTAGQVLDSIGLASIEFGVAQLGARLVVVLGHDDCGAVATTLRAHGTGEIPGGRIRAVIDGIAPSMSAVRRAASSFAGVDPDVVSDEHVRRTSRLLVEWSPVLAEHVANGSCAVVGTGYRLASGDLRVLETLGDIGDSPMATSPQTDRR